MKLAVGILLWMALLIVPAAALDDPYVGSFSGDLDGRHYQVSIDRFSADAYDGILLVDNEPMQLDARRYGELLTGLLQSHSEKFGFRARLQGGILVLETEDGRRIVMQRVLP